MALSPVSPFFFMHLSLLLKYTVKGIFHLPLAVNGGIHEPVTFYYDNDAGRVRMEYYGGEVSSHSSPSCLLLTSSQSTTLLRFDTSMGYEIVPRVDKLACYAGVRLFLSHFPVIPFRPSALSDAFLAPAIPPPPSLSLTSSPSLLPPLSKTYRPSPPSYRGISAPLCSPLLPPSHRSPSPQVTAPPR